MEEFGPSWEEVYFLTEDELEYLERHANNDKVTKLIGRILRR